MNNNTIQAAFASTFAFYLKAHNFHWNIEDEHFPEFHSFFGGIYDEVYGCIDGFAERIRTLGIKVPGSFSGFKYLSVIQDQMDYPTKDAMVAELLADNVKVLEILNAAFEETQSAKKFGFNNFLADRIDAHEKHGWMLRSILVEVEED